jgi:hypothetical protein
MSTPNVAAPASTTSQAPAPLFDPLQMSQPHPALLPGLITAYFQCLHHTTPIISHESVISQYLLSALPAVLANTLAGLAAPYVRRDTDELSLNCSQILLFHPRAARRGLGWSRPDVS